MSAVLARALCGVVVLVGLVGSHRSDGRIETEPPRARARVAASPVAAAPAAAPVAAIMYQDASIYRVHRVTAYCDRGVTASGVPSGVGQCAAPAEIPFGARIYIPELDRTFIVTDRTAKRFRHNTVDLFMPDQDACKQFGRKYLECEITLPVKAPRYGSPRLQAALTAATS